jgi:hypothetical protein
MLPGICSPLQVISDTRWTFASTLDKFVRVTTMSILCVAVSVVTCVLDTTITGCGLAAGAGFGCGFGGLEGGEPFGLSIGVDTFFGGLVIPTGFDDVSVELDGSPDTTEKGMTGSSFGGHVIHPKAEIATPITVTAEKKRG